MFDKVVINYKFRYSIVIFFWVTRARWCTQGTSSAGFYLQYCQYVTQNDVSCIICVGSLRDSVYDVISGLHGLCVPGLWVTWYPRWECWAMCCHTRPAMVQWAAQIRALVLDCPVTCDSWPTCTCTWLSTTPADHDTMPAVLPCQICPWIVL